MTTIKTPSITARARAAAELAHAGQVRKYTGEPYVTHCIAVASEVVLRGGDDHQVAAALLHDTLEDTHLTPADLVADFGQDVADLVLELTDVYTSEAYPSWNRALRKAAEAERIRRISPRAKLVKLCDIRDNTKDIVANAPTGFAALYLREKARVLEVLGPIGEAE